MVVYYQLSGVVAVVAMILNTFYILAILAYSGATLTLPGIAGLVLTVGMAVDTNVLIFERIREELRAGRSIRQAVDLGYNRASARCSTRTRRRSSPALPVPVRHGPDQGFAFTLISGAWWPTCSRPWCSRG